MDCKDTEENKVFAKFRLGRSCALSLSNDPSYVLHFAVQINHKEETVPLIAAAISGTNEIKIYSRETFCIQRSLLGHTQCVTGVCFDKNNPTVLWSTSLDGTLRYWNTAGKPNEHVILDNYDSGLTSFDISCDGSLLVTGSERKDDTTALKSNEKVDETVVHVKVWDIRKLDEKLPKCIATFESVHSDDVTKILFHPVNPKIVATGSTDGLITILDLTTYDEEDALLRTLNTESSVESFGFFGPNYEFLYAITSQDALQIWQYAEGEQLSSLINLNENLPKSHLVNYIIDCIYHVASQRLFVVAGSYNGSIEIFHFNLDQVEHYQSLKGGHSSTVRCFKYLNDCFFTGGEDGMVCAWLSLPADAVVTSRHVDVKMSKKARKASRKNPYNSVKS